jgi:hypothetical protein
MSSEDLDKILTINSYLIICKKKNPDCLKTKLVNSFLVEKIKKFLKIEKYLGTNYSKN